MRSGPKGSVRPTDSSCNMCRQMVEKLLSCSGDKLGFGQTMKMFDGFSLTAGPRVVVPLPKL